MQVLLIPFPFFFSSRPNRKPRSRPRTFVLPVVLEVDVVVSMEGAAAAVAVVTRGNLLDAVVVSLWLLRQPVAHRLAKLET